MSRRAPLCRNACPAARQRHGWTLIELLVVIALTSLLMGMFVTLLSSLLRYHRATGERVVQRAEMDRLIDTLRADLRHAVEVTPQADGRLIVALDTGERTCYSLDGARCRRMHLGRCAFAAPAKVFTIGPARAWRVEQQRVTKQPVEYQNVNEQGAAQRPVEQHLNSSPQTFAVWIDRPSGHQSSLAKQSVQIIAQAGAMRQSHSNTE